MTKYIYVVIDTESERDHVNNILGVWTNWQKAREQASLIRSYRMSNCIRIITYRCTCTAGGYWYQSLFEEPMPKPF